MNSGILVAVLIFACTFLASVAVWAIRKLAPRPEALPVTADWIDEIALDRYRPMLRLLDEEDFRLLRAQPGFTRKMEVQMRHQRCQIFRGYLKSLSGDFGRVCLALKLLMLNAGNDRPDLARVLLRSQLEFVCGVIVLQVKLAFFSCGIGTIDVASVLGVFDGLRLELRSLVPASMAAGA
jgi:hypothetical protein